MKIVFACPQMSFLRYFGPIIEYIKDEKNVEIYFAIRKDIRKYNSLQIEENYKIFLKILDSYFNSPEIINMSDKRIKCDILFTVSGFDNIRFDYNKHYAIQHGFDYLAHCKYTDSKTILLCNSEIYGLQAQAKYKTKFIVTPLPVAFSNLNTQIEFARKQVPTNKKVVTLFSARKGSIRLLRSIIKYLKKRDYFTVVKQRRKSQPVPTNIGSDLIVYDDIWYPSEAIFYPAISEIEIGFGSAIWTDLAEVGLNVIDNAIPKYAKKEARYIRPNLKDYWQIGKKFRKNIKKIVKNLSTGKSTIINIIGNAIPRYYRKKITPYYIRPSLENYWYIDKKFRKNTINIIEELSSKSVNNKKNIPENVIKQFYLDLLKI